MSELSQRTTPDNADAPSRLSGTGTAILKATRPWVRLAGAVCTLGGGIKLITALAEFALFSRQTREAGLNWGSNWANLIVPCVDLLGCLFYFIPAHLLMGLGKAMEQFTLTGTGQDIDWVLASGRLFWKVIGLLAIVAIGAAALLLFIAIKSS